MAVIASLEIELKASLDKFSSQMGAAVGHLDKLGKQFDKLKGSAGGSGAGFSKMQSSIVTLDSSLNLLSRGIGAAQSAYSSFAAVLDRGQAVTELTSAFKNLYQGTSLGVDGIGKLRSATDGLIGDLELLKSANTAAQQGLDPKLFLQLASSADALGDAVGQNASTALQQMTQALALGREKGLAPYIGKLTELDAAYKTYAASQGKLAKDLNDAGKLFVFQQVAAEKLAEKVAKLGTQSLTAKDQLDRLNNALDTQKNSVAESINKNAALTKVLGDLVRVVNSADASGFIEFAANLVTAAANSAREIGRLAKQVQEFIKAARSYAGIGPGGIKDTTVGRYLTSDARKTYDEELQNQIKQNEGLSETIKSAEQGEQLVKELQAKRDKIAASLQQNKIDAEALSGPLESIDEFFGDKTKGATAKQGGKLLAEAAGVENALAQVTEKVKELDAASAAAAGSDNLPEHFNEAGEAAGKAAAAIDRVAEAQRRVAEDVADARAHLAEDQAESALNVAVATGAPAAEIERIGAIYRETVRKGIVDGFVAANSEAGAAAQTGGEAIADVYAQRQADAAAASAKEALAAFDFEEFKASTQRAIETAFSEGRFNDIPALQETVRRIAEEETRRGSAAGFAAGSAEGLAAVDTLAKKKGEAAAASLAREAEVQLKQAHGAAVDFWESAFDDAVDGVSFDLKDTFTQLAKGFASELAAGIQTSLGVDLQLNFKNLGQTLGKYAFEYIKGSMFGGGGGGGFAASGGGGGGDFGVAELYQTYQTGSSLYSAGSSIAGATGTGTVAAGTGTTTGGAAAGGALSTGSLITTFGPAIAAGVGYYVASTNYDRISGWDANTKEEKKWFDIGTAWVDAVFPGIGSAINQAFGGTFGDKMSPEELNIRGLEGALEDKLRGEGDEPKDVKFFDERGQLEQFGGNIEVGPTLENMEGWGERFKAMGEDTFEVFGALGEVLNALGETTTDVGGQIGYILAENLNGNVDNARLLVQALELDFGQVEQAMLDAALGGEISWGKFISTLDDIAPAFGEGLVAMGDLTGSWNQLIASGGTGASALVGLQNIIIEAGESGATSFDELRDKMLAAGIAAEDIDKLFTAMADRGVNLGGSLEQLKGLSDVQLGAIVGQAQNLGLAFDSLPENVKESTDAVGALTHQVETLDSAVRRIPSEIKITGRLTYEEDDAPEPPPQREAPKPEAPKPAAKPAAKEERPRTASSRLSKGGGGDEDEAPAPKGTGVTGSPSDTRITPGANIKPKSGGGSSKPKGGGKKKAPADPYAAVVEELLKSIDPILADIERTLAAAVDVTGGVGKELTDLFAQRASLGEAAFGDAIKALGKAYGSTGQEKLFSRALAQVADQVKQTHLETQRAAQAVAEALGPLLNVDKSFNLLGNIDELRSAIGELSLDFDKAADSIVQAARKGTISWATFREEMTKLEDAFEPGLEAVGHMSGAFNNLIVSGGSGFDAIQAIRDLAVEGLEAGATTVDELAVKLKEFGIFDAGQIDALIAAMKAGGFGSATGGDLEDSVIASEGAFKDRAEFLNVVNAVKGLGADTALGADTFAGLSATLADKGLDPKSLGALQEIISQLLTGSLEELSEASDRDVGMIAGGLGPAFGFPDRDRPTTSTPLIGPAAPVAAIPIPSAVDAEEQRLIDRVASAKTAYETKRRTAELAAYRQKKGKAFAGGGAFEAGRLVPVPEAFTFNAGRAGQRGEAGMEIVLPAVRKGGIIGIGSVSDGSGGGGVSISIDARGAAPGVEHSIERALARFTDIAAAKALRASADHARRGGSYARAIGR